MTFWRMNIDFNFFKLHMQVSRMHKKRGLDSGGMD